MKKIFFTLLLSAGCWTAAQAKPWYVSSGIDDNGNANGLPKGSDTTGDGSPGAPYATIQKAADQTQAGDVVYVRGGTYRNNGRVPVVYISRPGNATQQITFQNYPGESPKLKFNDFQGFLIRPRIVGTVPQFPAYITIQGFTIEGNNSQFNNPDGSPNPGNAGGALRTPTNQPSGCDRPAEAPMGIYNGNGIGVDFKDGTVNSTATNIPHDLVFTGNTIFNCGGAGVGIDQADNITIQDNVVYNNCWYTRYGTSGITINSSRNYNNNANTTDYRTKILRNRCFGNRLYVPWYSDNSNSCKGFTDGNGIILDFNDTHAYKGRFLIANNLCVNNGGDGIQVLRTPSRVIVIHNTCYQNARASNLAGRLTDRGEININGSADVLVQNNILATNSTLRTYAGTATYTNNLFYNYAGGAAAPSNATGSVVANPQFVSPSSTDPRTLGFRLNVSTAPSPARDAGAAVSQAFLDVVGNKDLDGRDRVTGSLPDIGCYEIPAAARTALATSGPAGTTSQLDAYPNPFSGSATLAYTLDRPGPVRLEVVDLLGRRVALLVDETQDAGRHEARFAAPGPAAALYQVRLTTAQGTTAQKLASQP